MLLRETSQQRADAVERAVVATQNAPESVKVAAVHAVAGPGRRATDIIWIVVIAGLIGLLFYSLHGIIDLMLDNSAKKSPDKLITIFTTTFAGLIGLFAPSPLQNRGPTA
jgi:hypothetical protein